MLAVHAAVPVVGAGPLDYLPAIHLEEGRVGRDEPEIEVLRGRGGKVAAKMEQKAALWAETVPALENTRDYSAARDRCGLEGGQEVRQMVNFLTVARARFELYALMIVLQRQRRPVVGAQVNIIALRVRGGVEEQNGGFAWRGRKHGRANGHSRVVKDTNRARPLWIRQLDVGPGKRTWGAAGIEFDREAGRGRSDSPRGCGRRWLLRGSGGK